MKSKEKILNKMCKNIKNPSDLALETAAKAWCTPETRSIVMNKKLAFAFAEIIDQIWSRPWLGNATTKELLTEISARVDLDYKTVDK